MLSRLSARIALLGVLVGLVAIPTFAQAQASLINGLGGRGYGTTCLSPNDDGSSNLIDLTPAFPSGLQFFTGHYTTAYVNTNGNITFAGALSVFTPSAFPVASQPMIAPYWADVDIRPTTAGCGGYSASTGSPGNAACQNPATNGVWWHLEPGRMIVTWDHVGYFSCHGDKLMNFQLVLTAAPSCGGGMGDFDVEFRYNLCQWTTGDASGGSMGLGGTPAQVGFDAGDRTNFVQINGSRTPAINNIVCTMSNVMPMIPGIWRFQIRGGTIMCPGAGAPCNTGRPGICGDGRMQCVGSGMSCVGSTQPAASQCNGLDNNCDGTIDTGPCPAGTVCDGAQCVPMCVEGGCFAGQVCTTRGTCVETACATVTCPSGQRCVGGSCVGACTNVVCPTSQVCRNGQCVDPCNGLMCGMNQVCEAGLCQPRCPCRMCAAGNTCRSDGHCVPTPCANVMCQAGTVCNNGQCVDACAGAMCPMGQACMMGNCVMQMTPPDAGNVDDSGSPPDDSGTVDDSGAVVVPDGATLEPDGAIILEDGAIYDPDAGSSAHGDARVADARSDAGRGTRNPGCGCNTAGRSSARTPAALMLAGAAMMVVARRRRARR